MRLENYGFAGLYNPRPVQLVLEGNDTRYEVTLEGHDARTWTPGSEILLSAKLRVPADVDPGSYRLALRLPDDASALADSPGYAVRFANADVWDASTGDNVLTSSLLIATDAIGPRDGEATDFVEL